VTKPKGGVLKRPPEKSKKKNRQNTREAIISKAQRMTMVRQNAEGLEGRSQIKRDQVGGFERPTVKGERGNFLEKKGKIVEEGGEFQDLANVCQSDKQGAENL